MHKNIITATILTLALTVCAQISFSQTANDAEKVRLANELVEITFKAFPMNTFQDTIEKMKTESLQGFKSEISATLNAKIDETADISAARKAAIKAKVPNLVDKMAVRVETLIMQGLDMEQWIKETLAENYVKDLTVAELEKVNTFFKGSSGTVFFELVKEEAAAELEKRPSKSSSMLKNNDAVEIYKFMKTPPGEKFMAIFTKDADNFLNKKIMVWGEDMLKNLEQDIESGELNKLLVDFVAENLTGN
ncbi:MAG: hypothetical protein LUM44_03880 [Pyrinomonadaceae bacterium]|nr:hypothetical protein [Pyrinomonadaceae bacterium]